MAVTMRQQGRTARIVVRVTPLEKAEVLARAREDGITTSRWIRDRLAAPDDLAREVERLTAALAEADRRRAVAERRAMGALSLAQKVERLQRRLAKLEGTS